MLNNILKTIIQVIFKFSAFILNLFTLPLYKLLEVFFPHPTAYINVALDFFNYHVLRGVAFAREVFFNVTGFPRPLFSIFITIYLARIGLHVFLLMIRFVIHIIQFLHGIIPQPPGGVAAT